MTKQLTTSVASVNTRNRPLAVSVNTSFTAYTSYGDNVLARTVLTFD